jgi:hypothetical protein
MSDWVTALKFNGDVRGRFEGFYGDNPLFTDRNRLRYRVRFGVVASLLDDFEVGFKLASDEVAAGGANNEGDPISGNATFQNNGSKKLIYFDQAYGKWTPLKGPGLTGSFIVGKMENPFVFSDLVFDPDYTPEGVAAQFGYVINDKHSLKFNAGYFVIDELAASSRDPYLVGGQVRWDAAWAPKWSSTVGGAFLNLQNTSMLTTANVPNVQRGNTRSAATTLVYQYHPFVADASVTYMLAGAPFYTGAFPIKVGGDYIYNPSAAGNNYGYSLGFMLGKSGKKHTWDLSYTYKWLGANAMWEELVDSDFGAFYQNTVGANDGFVTAANPTGAGYGAGTNVKGHIMRFAYSPSDSLTLSMKWFLTSLITPFPGGSASDMSRVQVDAQWKF